MLKNRFSKILLSAVCFSSALAFAEATVMNPGTAVGQLVFLSREDVVQETQKYKSLNPLSIPVFAELPLDLSVIAGAITLKQQNLLSHVQLKSRARRTPNLDISGLEGGLNNPLLSRFSDGDWVRFELSRTKIVIEPATKSDAEAWYASRRTEKVRLKSDLTQKTIKASSELGSEDFVSVGSKAANYSELARILNTKDRKVVRPGYAIPFYYYQEFVEQNPAVKEAIQGVLDDPILDDPMDVEYRAEALKQVRDAFTNPQAIVNPDLLNDLLEIYEQQKDSVGKLQNMKMRSSTNSEDLPNFNGAGLYTSGSYKPYKNGKEKSHSEKLKSIKEVLQTVWSSVWELRAFDERNYFGIPHSEVKMGIQVNSSFGDEEADGVVVTKNISGDPRFSDVDGVYIEVQRGGEHAVANPQPGVKPQKILVIPDSRDLLNPSKYVIHVLQNSNVADDNKTILQGKDNPVPVMTDGEIVDLSFLVLKAESELKQKLDPSNDDFALDLEFKVDTADTDERQVYLKQARPYID